MIRNVDALTRRHLVQGRRSRLRRIERLERKLVRPRDDLERFDAALEVNGGALRACAEPVEPSWRGDMIRAILKVRRQASEPMTANEVADALIAAGLAPRVARKLLTQRGRRALDRQTESGMLRLVSKAPSGFRLKIA